MISIPRQLLLRLEEKISLLERKGIEAENAAAALNRALGDLLDVATERSRLSHEAHALLREMFDATNDR
jgi:hypothetical protein